MVCPNCGASNSEDLRCCDQCGHGLGTIDNAATMAMDRADLNAALLSGVEASRNEVPPTPGAIPQPGSTLYAPGSLFGTRYRIERLLGQGGMGAVYKAYDYELNRTVAIKLVRPEFGADPDTMARFKQELLLASRVSHKNILRIHDLGDWNGIKFITMAFVEGTDLAGLLRKEGPLSLELALKLTRALCAALEAAHAEGVMHRDLKPQNILIDHSGTPYIVDFGLAKLVQSEATAMTRTGLIMGTPRYMSPEQAVGAEVDHRSDLYSLGLILFEMFTGSLPFSGDSALQLMFQRVHNAPRDPREVKPDLPDYIAQIILKCLQKDPATRYQSAREILDDLDSQNPPAISGGVRASAGNATISFEIPRPTRRFGLILGAIAVTLLSTALAVPALRTRVFGLVSNESSAPKPAIEHYVAVLPLNISGDEKTLKYLAEGVTDSLSAKLSGLRNIYVASAPAVRSAISRQSPDKIARELGVALLVQGTIQGSGDRIALTLTLFDVSKNTQLLNREFSGVRQDLLTLEDQVFNALTGAMLIRQSNEEKARTTMRPTGDIAAYELYLKGRTLLGGQRTEADLRKALGLFDQAIKRDSQFALAFAGSADVSLLIWDRTKDGAWTQRALGAAEQAKRLNDNLPEVHLSLGSIYTAIGRTNEAIIELTRALELEPNSDDALHRLGLAYLKANRPAEAINAYKLATQVNPYMWSNYNFLGGAYFQLGQNQNALNAFTRITELDPANASGWANVGAANYRLGNWSACIAALQKAIKLDPDEPFFASQLGVAYFFAGRYGEAARMFETAVEKNPNDASFRVNLADAYRWTKQPERAAAAYDKAITLAYKSLEVNPRNTEALGNLAIAYAKKGDSANAIRFIRRARQIQPADDDLIYKEATIQALAGSAEDAVARLGDALRQGHSIEEVKSDPEFAALRDTPAFRRLQANLAVASGK
jgi:eukaryotic-like serine/threonine-protein kinase